MHSTVLNIDLNTSPVNASLKESAAEHYLPILSNNPTRPDPGPARLFTGFRITKTLTQGATV